MGWQLQRARLPGHAVFAAPQLVGDLGRAEAVLPHLAQGGALGIGPGDVFRGWHRALRYAVDDGHLTTIAHPCLRRPGGSFSAQSTQRGSMLPGLAANQ
jgi:hypothetical protein